METPKERKLKFFIAYETTTGKDVAEHLKKFLEKCIEVKEAFVAYNDIPLGQENEKEYRYKKIKEADYFILVLTSNAWEISEMLREETALAKKAGKKNFILIAQMRGANIPEELKLIQRLSTHPFETKEEIARKLGGIINDLYKTRLQERAPHEELNLVGESEFVKNIEEIINKNKRIYFYSPLPPINCLNEGYMNKITRLLDGAMEKDKNIFFLFCLNPTVEKMRNMLTSSNPNKELLKDKLLNDIEILLEKPYLKLIIPFDTILQTYGGSPQVKIKYTYKM
ncbi:MAG: hypothetical protein CVT89_05665 [Candidatus Altiarchaeales archaeon HGW-Altiarchaeales-2]|nr:MAG: hypothetical protein CVT89_05665 [Candidatus Altiarchaeales archaeon HGW-Altiarchaeales-2]